MRRIGLSRSLLVYLDELEYTEAALAADEETAELAQPYVEEIGMWDGVFGKERAGRRAVIRTHAVVAVRNAKLDLLTKRFGGMALIAELYEPDLAILPIGDHFTMGPKEAAKAVELLGVDKVVPQHFATLPALTGTPGDLIDLVPAGVEVFQLGPGDTISL